MSRDAREVMAELDAMERLEAGEKLPTSFGDFDGLARFVRGSASFVVPACYIATLFFGIACALVARAITRFDVDATTYALGSFVAALALGYVFIRAHFGALGAMILNVVQKLDGEPGGQ